MGEDETFATIICQQTGSVMHRVCFSARSFVAEVAIKSTDARSHAVVYNVHLKKEEHIDNVGYN